jgi:hypothetical protein
MARGEVTVFKACTPLVICRFLPFRNYFSHHTVDHTGDFLFEQALHGDMHHYFYGGRGVKGFVVLPIEHFIAQIPKQSFLLGWWIKILDLESAPSDKL